MKSYTVRDIPDNSYKTLRFLAGLKGTSINKEILNAIRTELKRKGVADPMVQEFFESQKEDPKK